MSTNGEKKCHCNRWAVSLQNAFESDQFDKWYRQAVQVITAEEYDRLPAMRHKEDVLSCLLGRLLLRQGARKISGAEWHEITFARTERGKPYLVTPEDTKFGLNVTHQGDYVAFASSCSSKVGVDCMRLDKERNNKSADEYINSMAKSASAEELRMMRSQPTEAMKMTMFYRYWCLKEAICKATGEGIMNDLTRLDFRVDLSHRYRPGCFVTSTTVLQDGQVQDQWIFEENFIDTNHSAAVCKERTLPRHCVFRQDPEAKIFFAKVDFPFLLEGTTVLNPMSDEGAAALEDFKSKPRKKF